MHLNFITSLLVIFVILALGQVHSKDYNADLNQARDLLRTTIKEGDGDLKAKLFDYVASSGSGKRYFLTFLVMANEVLNEVHVKVILEFLQNNGIDIMALFTLPMPPAVLESFEGLDLSKGLPKFKIEGNIDRTPFELDQIHDYVDLPRLVELLVNLLRVNEAFKKIWGMMSQPDVHSAVKEIVLKEEYWTVIEEIGSSSVGDKVDTMEIALGLMKMFNVRGDKRNISSADRFIEGAISIWDCKGDGEDSNVCITLKRLKKNKTEL